MSVLDKLRSQKAVSGAVSPGVQILEIRPFLQAKTCLPELYSPIILPDYLSYVMGTKTDDIFF